MREWDYFMDAINAIRKPTRLHNILTPDNIIHSKLALEAIKQNISLNYEMGENDIQEGLQSIVATWNSSYLQGMLLGLIFSLERYNKNGIVVPLDNHNAELTNIYSAVEAMLIERMGQI
tara:strand:- start:1611 stop:1967 length:357 start_codon:yes stop_codon:yes gene_type:complete